MLMTCCCHSLLPTSRCQVRVCERHSVECATLQCCCVMNLSTCAVVLLAATSPNQPLSMRILVSVCLDRSSRRSTPPTRMFSRPQLQRWPRKTRKTYCSPAATPTTIPTDTTACRDTKTTAQHRPHRCATIQQLLTPPPHTAEGDSISLFRSGTPTITTTDTARLSQLQLLVLRLPNRYTTRRSTYADRSRRACSARSNRSTV